MYYRVKCLVASLLAALSLASASVLAESSVLPSACHSEQTPAQLRARAWLQQFSQRDFDLMAQKLRPTPAQQAAWLAYRQAKTAPLPFMPECDYRRLSQPDSKKIALDFSMAMHQQRLAENQTLATLWPELTGPQRQILSQWYAPPSGDTSASFRVPCAANQAQKAGLI